MLVVFIGSSGCGKSTIMKILSRTRNFFYVRNVTTRHARFSEYHKTTLSKEEFSALEEREELVLVNEYFGNRYGYLKTDVDHATASHSIVCMIDFGIEKIAQLDGFPNTYRIVVLPESEEVLRDVIARDRAGRDPDAAVRLHRRNYGRYTDGENEELGAFVVTNRLGEAGTVAFRIAEYISVQLDTSWRAQASRRERFAFILENLRTYPPATNGLQAYKMLTEAIDNFEDQFDIENWSPPRTYRNGARTRRLYTIFPESFFEVSQYHGVTLLLSKAELVFISKNGAIEIQEKNPNDPMGEKVHFARRDASVMFRKPDSDGNGVWHDSSR